MSQSERYASSPHSVVTSVYFHNTIVTSTYTTDIINNAGNEIEANSRQITQA